MSYKLEKHIQTATNGNIVNLVLHSSLTKFSHTLACYKLTRRMDCPIPHVPWPRPKSFKLTWLKHVSPTLLQPK